MSASIIREGPHADPPATPSGIAAAPVYVPAWLRPLVDPGMDEKSLPRVVTNMISRFEFQTMLYGSAKTKHRGGDERFFFWVMEYDRESYAEIVPRIS